MLLTVTVNVSAKEAGVEYRVVNKSPEVRSLIVKAPRPNGAFLEPVAGCALRRCPLLKKAGMKSS